MPKDLQTLVLQATGAGTADRISFDSKTVIVLDPQSQKKAEVPMAKKKSGLNAKQKRLLGIHSVPKKVS